MSASCENLGSFIHPADVPELQLYHWCIVFAGLAIGVGLVFELINMTGTTRTGHKERLYTASNVWLIFSGVVHVSSKCVRCVCIPVLYVLYIYTSSISIFSDVIRILGHIQSGNFDNSAGLSST